MTESTINVSGSDPQARALRPSLKKYAWLSIGAAVVTIGLKTAAWRITGSVGLLSDALESLINLAAAFMALILISVAERPPDAEHAFGHSKAEYFSSGIEGALIFLAAAGIIWTAVPRLLDPQPIEQAGIGLAVAIAASAINLAVAIVLRNAGRKYHSIALEADSHHLMTDVWTSVGVVIAVALVALTGWLILDPIIALAVAANIIWMGVKLMQRSALGLMDTAFSPSELALIEKVFEPYRAQGIEFHALRTRDAGARRFMSFHILAPGNWTIQQGHQLAEQIESDLRTALPRIVVFSHIEPLDDPAAMEDQTLDRA
jgi:cation diffusion facilitator family transporter